MPGHLDLSSSGCAVEGVSVIQPVESAETECCASCVHLDMQPSIESVLLLQEQHWHKAWTCTGQMAWGCLNEMAGQLEATHHRPGERIPLLAGQSTFCGPPSEQTGAQCPLPSGQSARQHYYYYYYYNYNCHNYYHHYNCKTAADQPESFQLVKRC